MRHILHTPNPPVALRRAVARGTTNWDRFDAKEAVSEALDTLQMGLCAYCQTRVDSDIGSHIEHLWPKHAHPAMTFQWDNLVLSCTHSDEIGIARLTGGVSCGHSDGKRRWPAYDPRFVLPTEADCERYFEYRASDGTVQPARELSAQDAARAAYTIDLLNLNCRRLCRLRKDMLEEGYRIIRELRSEGCDLAHFLECELSAINGRLRSFFTARQQHFQAFA
jgi:uncharacterized protein (TIGR02646 family)